MIWQPRIEKNGEVWLFLAGLFSNTVSFFIPERLRHHTVSIHRNVFETGEGRECSVRCVGGVKLASMLNVAPESSR